MKTPEEKIFYAVICEEIPAPHLYFETYKEAEDCAKSGGQHIDHTISLRSLSILRYAGLWEPKAESDGERWRGIKY